MSDIFTNAQLLDASRVTQVFALCSCRMAGEWGPLLKEARERRYWPKARVAREAHIAPNTYASIEKGGHTQTRKLEAVARVLDLDVTIQLIPKIKPETSESNGQTDNGAVTENPRLQPEADLNNRNLQGTIGGGDSALHTTITRIETVARALEGVLANAQTIATAYVRAAAAVNREPQSHKTQTSRGAKSRKSHTARKRS